tara:strand:- start:480 stop:1433 length:954 start_codon:yes stop_codon:yes gene_type:complete
MLPVKFDIINLDKIKPLLADLMLPQDLQKFNNYVVEYESVRPDCLRNIDIFCEGERASSQVYARFDFFKREATAPDVLVSPFYLELFEFSGCGNYIADYVRALATTYPDQTLVFQWNHDNDFYKYSSQIQDIPNIKVINFGNTTYRAPCDIIVPFWNVSTNLTAKKKKLLCSFVGSVNNPTRHALASAIVQRKDDQFGYIEKLPEKEYLSFLSSCYFSLCPLGGVGGSGFSYRFFECLHLNTVPVLMVNRIVFPYEDLDWNNLCVRIPENYHDIDGIRNILVSLQFRLPHMLEYIGLNRLRFTLGGVQEEVYNKLKL